MDPELNLSNLITPRTVAVHLWHEMLDRKPPPAGSPLHEIMSN